MSSSPSSSSVLQVESLGFPWKTFDPFLFCAYHHDFYPSSSSNGTDFASLGPDRKLLKGRDIGSDFSNKDGWSMYHGEIVPGFPMHPHYGFETVTVVREGLVDHSDSLGATARYGRGDAQWLTAGGGICHAEMFPLVRSDAPNTLDLFQIWVNLPKEKKKAKPFFSMAWADEQPRKSFGTEIGKQAHVRLVGGSFLGLQGVPPPPDSWASDPRSEIIIATIKLDPGASLVIPRASSAEINRTLYFFSGSKLSVDDSSKHRNPMVLIRVSGDRDTTVRADETGDGCEMLFLQGRPIGEPVVQRGPFVTNSWEELAEVSKQYRLTEFGGWKWGRYDPVHPRDQGRFYTMDGKTVTPSVKESISLEDESKNDCSVDTK